MRVKKKANVHSNVCYSNPSWVSLQTLTQIFEFVKETKVPRKSLGTCVAIKITFTTLLSL